MLTNVGEKHMTISNSEYIQFLTECESLISTIKTYIELEDRLSSFLCVEDNDEDGNVAKLVPMSLEHFKTLRDTSRKISSYADRLYSLLSRYEHVVESLSRS